MIPGTAHIDCCGCTACYHVCPNACIHMTPDAEGFLYPEIETDKCIECGMCAKICPHQHGESTKESRTTRTYAVKHKNDSVRMLSSSGGVFTAVSDWILASGGAVYGAVLDESNHVAHRKARTASERDQFRKSKYVQSELSGVFSEAKQDLVFGREVLFSGTPCQIAGLKAYLGKNHEKLITCDVICHGVPSPKLFADYLAFVGRKYRSGINRFDFRPKENGWGNYSPGVVFRGGRKIGKSRAVESYIRIYFTNLALRPSCYACRYACIDRNSDLTFGDFWGIEKHYPEFADEKGISLLMVNSDRGRYVFDQIRDHLHFLPTPVSECMQTNLHSPTQARGDRRLFWDRYAKYGYAFLAKHYGGCNSATAVKEAIRKMLSKSRKAKSKIVTKK